MDLCQDKCFTIIIMITVFQITIVLSPLVWRLTWAMLPLRPLSEFWQVHLH